MTQRYLLYLQKDINVKLSGWDALMKHNKKGNIVALFE